jgi:hypothetical protein
MTGGDKIIAYKGLIKMMEESFFLIFIYKLNILQNDSFVCTIYNIFIKAK